MDFLSVRGIKGFIRERDCLAITGLSLSTRERMMGLGTFPKKVKISDRNVGWYAKDIEEWIQSCIDNDVNRKIKIYSDSEGTEGE